MLSNTSKLYFPKIIYTSAGIINPKHQIESDTSEPKLISLYKLDWNRKSDKCAKTDMELGEEYELLLNSLVFAIPDGYLKEIRRCSWRAVEEWNAIRNIDSIMKAVYLLPTTAYIETAFKLLADCTFDQETNFYYRGKNKKVLLYILLYKFWKNQTNRNLLFSFSKLSELLTISIDDTLNEDDASEINRFLTYVNTDLGK